VKSKVAITLMAVTGTIAASGAVAAPPTAPDGAAIFKQRCAACHSVQSGKSGGVGPNLAGLVGRKAGSGSYNYSPAMKKAELTWNIASLDKFLAAPLKTVPGTRMVIALPDPAQRKAVIGYLGQQK